MITVTHVLTKNGSTHTEIPNDRRVETVIRRAPTLLDGTGRFAVSLARLPEGKRLRDDLPSSWADCFLQAAGSADAMMIEARKVSGDGSENLYRVVRSPALAEQAADSVDIAWNERIDYVPAEEAFSAEEAGDIFWHCYQHDAVPAEYELRLLE